LKAYWGLSMKGIIKRAQVVGAIDGKAATRLYKQHSARGYNAAEPYPLKPEPSTLVDAAISVHLKDHGYTRDELAAAALLSPEEFVRDFLKENPSPEQVRHADIKPDNVFSLADRRRGPSSA
jgi:hypothetical protein